MKKHDPRQLTIGKTTYNSNWLRTVTLAKAKENLPKVNASQVTNAWKQANGLSVRNYTRSNDSGKSEEE